MTELEQRQEAFENLAYSLIGHEFTRVIYYDMQEETGTYSGSYDSTDSVNWGAAFLLDDGREISVSWPPWHEANENGLHLETGAFLDVWPLGATSYSAWKILDSANWHSFRKMRITAVEIYWEWHQEENRLVAPFDLVLTFDAGQRLFVCAGYYDGKKFLVMAGDNLTFVFDEDTAKRLGIGPYADPCFKRQRQGTASQGQA